MAHILALELLRQKDFFLDTWNHAFVHLQKFKEGDASEDHLGHLACNVAFLIWALKNGIISQEDVNGAVRERAKRKATCYKLGRYEI